MVVSQLVQVLFKGVDAGVNRTLDAISAKGDKANKSLLSIDTILKTGFGVLAAEKTLRIMSKIADETFRAAGMSEQWNKATQAIKTGFFEGLAAGLGDTLKDIIILLEDSAPTIKEWGIALGQGISFAIDAARDLYNWIVDILKLQRATFGLSAAELADRVTQIDAELEVIRAVRRESAGVNIPELGRGEDRFVQDEARLLQERDRVQKLQQKYGDLEASIDATTAAQVTGANKATKATKETTKALEDQEKQAQKLAAQYTAGGGLSKGVDDLLDKWARIGDVTRQNVMAAGDALQSGLSSALVEVGNNFKELDKIAKQFFDNLMRMLQELAARQLIAQAFAMFVGGAAASTTSGGNLGSAGSGRGGPRPGGAGEFGGSMGMMGFGAGAGGGGGGVVVVHNHINLSRKLDRALIERQDLVVGLSREAMATDRGGYRTAVQGVARR